MAVVALSPGVINTDMLASCFGDSASLYQSPDTWYSMMLYFLHQFGSLCKQKEKHIVPLNFLRLEHKGDVSRWRPESDTNFVHHCTRALKAATMILNLTAADNGASLTV